MVGDARARQPAPGAPPSAEELWLGAKQPRGRNALHVALTDNDSTQAASLIATGNDLLLCQPSEAGCTPLMLLAMGHCDESLVWALLARRASVEASAAARSSE